MTRPRTSPTPLALTALLCALLGVLGEAGADSTLALLSFLVVAAPAIEARARASRRAAVRTPAPWPRALPARAALFRPPHRRRSRRAVLAHRRGLIDAVATPLIA